MTAQTQTGQNPLAYENTGKLIVKFAIPSIISGLVSALYNIVDQIFIGQGVGILGNAATNVAFPLTTLCTALTLLLGVGTAANFSLNLGAGQKDKARQVAGNGIFYLTATGISLALLVFLFLRPLLHVFGASEQVYPLALTYTRITTWGIPFLLFSVGLSNFIRADGSPTYSMLCTLSGALLNTILDPLFIFHFEMGIAGAAWATIIGQILSACMAFAYLFRTKNVTWDRSCFKPRLSVLKEILTLGMSPFFNHSAMMAVQITMNNTLTYYGALSAYGSEIPMACVGVITKVNVIYIAFVIGTSQGCQPILGFNYGARQFDRVRRTFRQGLITVTGISVCFFLCFQLFPRQIIHIFGKGDELYYQFGIRYFRIFMMLIFVNGFQPICSFLFTAIGKARKGVIVSLTRQILFLLPLILIFPRFFGIDGVMYAGPIADGAAAILAISLVIPEMRRLREDASQVS
ncbi:MAG: MATE family efflux transporter [Lachnospiraceae bacterium]|nr:MATE family efflux transporter [Lachnospiraceae bacterium]